MCSNTPSGSTHTTNQRMVPMEQLQNGTTINGLPYELPSGNWIIVPLLKRGVCSENAPH